MNLKLVILQRLSLYQNARGSENLLRIEVGMVMTVGDTEWAVALRELAAKGQIKDAGRHALTNDKMWSLTKKGEEAMLP